MPRSRLETQRTHDPTVLRAIAHPMRNRILNEMSATGPTRAADIAADLGILWKTFRAVVASDGAV